MMKNKNIGVFICWCGSNIAEVVDVDKVKEVIINNHYTKLCEYYKYLCSEPGQQIIIEAIRNNKLDAVVIAACSPNMHEGTFKECLKRAGLNPYLLEMANIREQCSWVHRLNKEEATNKAIAIIESMIAKVIQNEVLYQASFPIEKRALIIGGGIAGIQSALDIANAGYEVVLVEKEPSIGGRMAQLSETFPTLDCSQCILTPRMVEVASHPAINLLTYHELVEISGYVGNFNVKLKRKPTYVNRDECNCCMKCMEKCPVKVESEFERGLGIRKAIYIPFPQAVPNKPVIDKEACIYLTTGKCGVCKKVCEVDAINFEDKEEIKEIKVGAIVVATGYQLYKKENLAEYGYGKYKDVIDALGFERLNSAAGPTGGKIIRPSNGKIPKEVVFIQCVASRATEPEHGLPYCSRICCMYTAKQAILYKRKVPDGQAYVFYIDIRAGGKKYEEFIQKGIEQERIVYLRGRVARLYEEDGKIIIQGVDTLTNKRIEIAAELVILSPAVIPQPDADALATKLKIQTDEYNFMQEAHPKLRPVETLSEGIYLAGCCSSPKDIPDTVASASAAASKVVTLFSKDKFLSFPYVVALDEELCQGCMLCIEVCPYEARELDRIRNIAKVIEALCQGCGACISACPNKASQQKNIRTTQIFSMIETLS